MIALDESLLTDPIFLDKYTLVVLLLLATEENMGARKLAKKIGATHKEIRLVLDNLSRRGMIKIPSVARGATNEVVVTTEKIIVDKGTLWGTLWGTLPENDPKTPENDEQRAHLRAHFRAHSENHTITEITDSCEQGNKEQGHTLGHTLGHTFETPEKMPEKDLKTEAKGTLLGTLEGTLLDEIPIQSTDSEVISEQNEVVEVIANDCDSAGCPPVTPTYALTHTHTHTHENKLPLYTENRKKEIYSKDKKKKDKTSPSYKTPQPIPYMPPKDALASANNKQPSGARACEAPLDERRKAFGNELVPYLEKYGKEMLRAFYDYWTEVGSDEMERDNKGVMRWEKEKRKKGTFQISRRLATWHRNNYGNQQAPKYETYQQRRKREEEERMQGYRELLNKYASKDDDDDGYDPLAPLRGFAFR